MPTDVGLAVVAQWLAAGFSLHVAWEQAIQQRGRLGLRRATAVLALAIAAYLVANPIVSTGSAELQPWGLTVQVAALGAMWLSGNATVTALTGEQPPRWLTVALVAAAVAGVVAVPTGAFSSSYATGEGPGYTPLFSAFLVLPFPVSGWWVLRSARRASDRRLGRQLAWVLGVAAGLFGLVAVLAPSGATSLMAITMVPALWWLSGIVRTAHQRRRELAARSRQRVADLSSRLASTEDELARAEAASTALVDATSHELRTPLAVIMGAVELLGREGVPEEATERALDLIDRNAHRLNELVDYLLAAQSTRDANRIPLQDECTVRTPVTTALSLYRDVDVTCVVPDELQAWVDPLDAVLIVTAMVSNAERHGGDTILVEARDDGRAAVISVADDGDGVPEGFVDRLFEPFAQPTHGLRRRQTGGLGLGLSVARDRAIANGGDLRHVREEGWTRFELWLPRTPDQGPMIERRSPSGRAAARARQPRPHRRDRRRSGNEM